MEGSFESKVEGGLGFETLPEIDQNKPKLIIWSIWVALGRNGFEIILKLILWSIRAASGLGPEMVPKQTASFSEQHPPSAWGSLSNTLRGLGAFQDSLSNSLSDTLRRLGAW